MADKLILNADLNYKTAEFTPEKCTVEKVIEVSETEFRKFYEKPMKPDYYLSMYKNLMGFYDESYHCVLLINEQNGDGLLINSEGADYARYSQYIPNARGIIRQREQTAALDTMKTRMDCCIDRWIKQHANENQFGISLTDIIDESNFAEALVEHVSEGLCSDPRIGDCELTHNSIEVTKRELVETRLYSPLRLEVDMDDDDGGYLTYIDSANYVDYDDEINENIRKDLCSDKDAVERGLAAYFHDKNLDRKVHSIMPMVETRNGDLYGVAIVQSYGELDRAEMVALTQYLTGQYADGWGEGYEQHPVELGEDEVYISFWNSNDEYFLKPESEVFPTQNFEQAMGGI